MAQAWLDASGDLRIRVVHPFKFVAASGHEAETVGVYLPDFGCPQGTVLLCRFDPEELSELLETTEYFSSGLNPRYYEPYRRKRFVHTLSDWGWYGPPDAVPDWYDPQWREKLK
jgi:hypothetical protein